MSKLMSLEILSSIYGAEESAAVNELFNIVKDALPDNSSTRENDFSTQTVTTSALRSDVAIESSEKERELILKNFPASKNGYLVVSKVIED